MKKSLFLVLLTLALLLFSACGAVEQSEIAASITPAPAPEKSGQQPLSAAEIFSSCIDSVVFLQNNGGGGTGFFIEENIIATNNHVVAGCEWMTVTTSDGSVYDVTEVLAHSENPDLALLRVDFGGEPLALNSHGISEGEPVYALGAAMGIYPCISDGIVMKGTHIDNDVNYILSNFHAIGGNSGGPLLNAYGELVGVVVGGMSDGPNSIDMVINAEHLAGLDRSAPYTLSTKAEYTAKMNRPDEENYEFADISSAQPGQLIRFGKYEQDNDMENGPEDILWLVLGREGNEINAMSLYCLDVLPYHNSFEAVTWETSDLRAFLNGEFIDSAFSAEEKGLIVPSTVINNDNPVYGTPGGNDTTDLVYLPSLEEIMQYYDIPDPVEDAYSQLYAQATAYTISKGVWLEIADSTRCWWWLRSSGGAESMACEVGSAGYLSFNGTEVTKPERAIRPVISILAQ